MIHGRSTTGMCPLRKESSCSGLGRTRWYPERTALGQLSRWRRMSQQGTQGIRRPIASRCYSSMCPPCREALPTLQAGRSCRRCRRCMWLLHSCLGTCRQGSVRTWADCPSEHTRQERKLPAESSQPGTPSPPGTSGTPMQRSGWSGWSTSLPSTGAELRRLSGSRSLRGKLRILSGRSTTGMCPPRTENSC